MALVFKVVIRFCGFGIQSCNLVLGLALKVVIKSKKITPTMTPKTLTFLLVIFLASLLTPAQTHTLTGEPDSSGVYPEAKRDQIDDDWQKILDTTLSNPAAVHPKDTILRLAFNQLIHEDLDEH